MSAQILSGEISREFAVSQIENSPLDPSTRNEMINYVIKKPRSLIGRFRNPSS